MEGKVTDLTGIGKLADSKLLNQFYSDAIEPAAKELGAILGNTAKAAHLILAPIQLMAVGQHYFKAMLEEIIASVPEERQQPAKPSISAPVLMELRFTEEGSHLRTMYMNLLKRAIDKERCDEAHPAFVKLVGQLSPLEAVLLRFMNKEPIVTVECRKHAYSQTAFVEMLETNFRDEHGNNRIDELSMCLEHLEGLNIAHYYVDRAMRQPTVSRFPESTGLMTLETKSRLSQLGKLFVRACEP